MANESLIPFKDFQGIVRAVGANPSNTFEDLVNLRNDKTLGGLCIRDGFRTIQDLTFQPDAFIYNKFVDCESLVLAGNNAIYAAPAIQDDQLTQSNTPTDITSGYYTTIQTANSSTLFTLSTVPSFSLLYAIVFNQTVNEYRIVKVYNSTTKQITVHRSASNWAATNILVISRVTLSTQVVGGNSTIRKFPNGDVSGDWTPTPRYSRINTLYNRSTPITSQIVGLIPQYETIRPDGESDVIAFVPSSGSGNCYSMVNESTPNDSTYIESGFNVSTIKFSLTNPSVCVSGFPLKFRVRARKTTNLRNVILYVGMLDGNTVIPLRLYSDPVLTTEFQDFIFNTADNVVVGSNGANLRISFATDFMYDTKVQISFVEVQVPTSSTATNVTSAFRVSMENLVGSEVMGVNDNIILYFAAQSSQYNANPNIICNFYDGSTLIVTRTVQIIEGGLGREYAVGFPAALLSAFNNLEVEFVATSSMFGGIQIFFYYMTIDIVPVAGATIINSMSMSKIGYPSFAPIDGFSNLILSGIKERYSNNSLWIGRIGSRLGQVGETRKFFGTNGFEFNGLYVAPIIDNQFKAGAFRDSSQHIEVKTVAGILNSEKVLPNSDISNSGFQPNTGTDLFAVVDDDNDTDWIGLTAIGIATRTCSLGLVDTLSSNHKINQDGNIEVFYVGRKSGSNIQDTAYTYIELYEVKNGVNVLLGSSLGQAGNPQLLRDYGTGFTPYSFFVPASYLNNLANVFIKVTCTGNVATGLNISRLYIVVPLAQNKLAIDNTGMNPIFSINLSFEEDGFNDTRLLYKSNYGVIQDGQTTYEVANQLKVGNNTTDKYIGVLIKTDLAELVNRRYTSIKIWGGIESIEGVIVWRLCDTIAFSDANWKLGADGKTYSIEVVIGNEINTAETYTTKVDLDSFYSAVDAVVDFANLQGKSFVIPEKNERVVVRSPINDSGFATSVLADQNFSEFVNVGNCNGVVALNDKIIVFKQHSYFSMDANGNSRQLSENIGLASRAALAIAENRIAIFPSFDGIYYTDGFKNQLTNLDWLVDYRNYSAISLMESIGFYNSYNNSYYWICSEDVWVLDFKSMQWHKESFFFNQENRIFGTPSTISKRLDGRIAFADTLQNTGSGYMQLYEFPRSDQRPTNKIRTQYGVQEVATLCSVLTNPYDIDDLMISDFIDKFYIKSNVLATSPVINVINQDDGSDSFIPINIVTITLKDGDKVIKTVLSEMGRSEIPVYVSRSVTRFALAFSFYVSGFLVIREFGLKITKQLKAGSTTQFL